MVIIYLEKALRPYVKVTVSDVIRIKRKDLARTKNTIMSDFDVGYSYTRD